MHTQWSETTSFLKSLNIVSKKTMGLSIGSMLSTDAFKVFARLVERNLASDLMFGAEVPMFFTEDMNVQRKVKADGHFGIFPPAQSLKLVRP
jgi:hypothetical protein